MEEEEEDDDWWVGGNDAANCGGNGVFAADSHVIVCRELVCCLWLVEAERSID